MNTPGSVTQLLTRLRSEDPVVRDEAATAIWTRYCGALLDLACQHLDQRLQRRVGAEDVVQKMFKSFFLRQRRGLYHLGDRNDLLGLLVRMTLNKVRSAVTREARRRRDYRRDQAVTQDETDPAGPDGWLLEQAARARPTPDEAAALDEEAELRLAQLPDDLRQITLYKLEGYTNAEIAAIPKARCSVRTVERKLRLIREAWGVFD
jgi:DNA-directed RNA polymerase specialized sigma24 family protein